MKSNAKLLSIMTEKVFQHDVVELLEREGAKGYTIFEGGGSGPFHEHQSQHASMVDEFRIVKFEAIITEEQIAEHIAKKMVDEFFNEKPGVVSLSDIEVFRTHKF